MLMVLFWPKFHSPSAKGLIWQLCESGLLNLSPFSPGLISVRAQKQSRGVLVVKDVLDSEMKQFMRRQLDLLYKWLPAGDHCPAVHLIQLL